jgi:hypothetical protein
VLDCDSIAVSQFERNLSAGFRLTTEALSRFGRDQPWRCLWRGLSQITMTRPWRRITLHLSQIGLTLGLTFMSGLSLSAAGYL